MDNADGPAKLNSPQDREALLQLAERHVIACRFGEAQTLMARLAAEIPGEEFGAMLTEAGEQWLKIATLTDEKNSEALGLLIMASATAVKGQFRGSIGFFNLLRPMITPELGPSLNLLLYYLAVKGAAEAESQ